MVVVCLDHRELIPIQKRLRRGHGHRETWPTSAMGLLIPVGEARTTPYRVDLDRHFPPAFQAEPEAGMGPA